ncbi:hypothetical protein IEQ34_006839 [Dendrobium chrysotoxum]|uniref:Uncharacterized protein n=1 Tax=Dendrobium chrysotoxum TaxID=161865 RepID=A0AAV7H7Y1_DENCH|nr:hypothetical protein IEQ34_006839 [Dendrobium chrysotoxum]
MIAVVPPILPPQPLPPPPYPIMAVVMKGVKSRAVSLRKEKVVMGLQKGPTSPKLEGMLSSSSLSMFKCIKMILFKNTCKYPKSTDIMSYQDVSKPNLDNNEKCSSFNPATSTSTTTTASCYGGNDHSIFTNPTALTSTTATTSCYSKENKGSEVWGSIVEVSA